MEELPPELRNRRDAIYERVVRRGRFLRRHARARGATTIAVVVALLGGSLAVAVGQTHHDRRVVTLGTTTTSEPARPEPSASTRPTVPPTTHAPPTTATTPTTNPRVTGRAGPTTTSLTCHNSHDPACGPLRFVPRFVNAPATVNITSTPAKPLVGQTVTFRVHIADPDSGKYAASPGCYPSGQFGDGAGPDLPVCVASCAVSGYGPWDPPKTEPADLTYTFRHEYAKAGNYTAEFSLLLAQCEPWSSPARGSTVVKVTRS